MAHSTSASRLPLTSRQLTLLAIGGALLWLLAALLLRWLGPLGLYEGRTRLLAYALIVPGTVPFVPLLRRVCGLPRDWGRRSPP